MRVKLGILKPGQVLGYGNGQTTQTLITSTTNVVGITSNYTTNVFDPHYVRATTLVFANIASPSTALTSIA